jgi:hypothetical protein
MSSEDAEIIEEPIIILPDRYKLFNTGLIESRLHLDIDNIRIVNINITKSIMHVLFYDIKNISVITEYKEKGYRSFIIDYKTKDKPRKKQNIEIKMSIINNDIELAHKYITDEYKKICYKRENNIFF